MTDARGAGAPALLDEAMRLHQQGNLEQATNFYSEALKQEPNNSQALRLYGILAREIGNHELSLKLLINLAKLQPENSIAYDEIGLTYMASGHLDDAANALDHALGIDPNSLRTLSNKGALLHFRGRAAEAVAIYRKALAIDPGDIDTQCNLAKALADSGAAEAGIKLCNSAIKQTENHPLPVSIKATILADTGKHQEAADLFESLREFAEYDESVLINLGFSYQQLGELEKASLAWRQAVDINPHNARAVSDLAYTLITEGNSKLALELCEGFLLRHPAEPLVLAAAAYSISAGNHECSIPELLDYQNLIYPIKIKCPEGFASLDEFNSELGKIITSDDSLTAEPLNKSTSGGSQTGELELHSNPALQQLRDIIQSTIEKTCGQLKQHGLAKHPMLTKKASEYGLRAWGTLLNSGGRQTSHIHPTAWISGVYYVSVPEDLDGEAGWIELGNPPERTGILPQLPDNFATHRVKPEPGLIVLFPSYMYHQTISFKSASPRISIAFDALPFSSMAMF
ncbi:MAG: tetratricopeptide repeat protein [Gammaproteobacteria bacterium]|nr:tetratricopeptide repeat protein [Gammaproteobacteria bacterium]